MRHQPLERIAQTWRQRWQLLLIVTLVSASAGVAAEVAFDPDSRPPMPIASYTLEVHDLGRGPVTAFRPWFENAHWQGDVVQYVIDETGKMTTDVTMASEPVKADGALWSARGRFIEAETKADYWKTGRKIITASSAGKQIAFRWDHLDKAQRERLDPATASIADATGSYASKLLNYVRGDRSQEGATGGLRERRSILGDIIGSQPVYVGAPTAGYTFPGYADFRNAQRLRAGRVYVGANDGMLHAFAADTGKEVFAYVPSLVHDKLRALAAKPYQHTYFVDGLITTGDAEIDSHWRTLLTGGLGAGGKGLYALDITHPNLSSETSSASEDRKLLFEIDAASDKDIGHIYGKPAIAKLPDGKWYIVTGNGFGSTNGTASLLLVALDSGQVTKRQAHSGPGNGLAAVSLVDSNFDHVADFAYAGDLLGNLWKFDLNDPQSSPVKLYAAGADHPITSAPELAAHPAGGHLVYFGTGALLESNDIDDLKTQSIFAIWDHTKALQDASRELLKPTFEMLDSADGRKLRIASRQQPDWSKLKGWQIDLPETGERLIGTPQVRAGRLQFVTTNPVHNGSAWLMMVDWLSGGAPSVPAFDLNKDGKLDEDDSIASPATPPAGVHLGEGAFSQPAFARIKQGVDAIYINGLRLGELLKEEPCTGACNGGIAGGHIDVDMDTSLGGATDSHVHEYDDKFNVTYVDYLNINPIKGSGLRSIDAVGIAPEKRLVALIANADLSPAAVLTIKGKQWNVVEYQKLIQQKLKAWNRSSALLDDDGKELSFTLSDLKSAPATALRIGFKSDAILRGGVIPTQTGCVIRAPSITNGRWRNGALTLHVIDVTQPSAFAFKLQEPSDLKSVVNVDGKDIALVEDTNKDGTPDVRYGGVLADPASSTSGFVYESTLFWHYSGACYGNAKWAEDAKNAIAAGTGDEKAGTTAASKLQAQLIKLENSRKQAIWELNHLLATSSDTKKIKDKQALIDKLTAEIDQIKLKLGMNSGSGSGGTAPTVSATVDVSTVVAPVHGPNFIPGRRSWIDLIR